MPSPPSLGGAGLAEVAQTVRLPGRRIPLALRRWSQRPSIDRLALDFRQFSFRHVTRVSPSTGFSVFSPLSALPAGSCPLTLSSLGKPLTQGSPLNPSHLRWGCCMNYCGAPDAGGSQVQCVVRPRSVYGFVVLLARIATNFRHRASPDAHAFPAHQRRSGMHGKASWPGRPDAAPVVSNYRSALP